MSMHAHPLEEIPELTARIARTSFPKGTIAMMLRDALEGVYNDEAFEKLYPRRGREALAPWRLALVMVLQTIENLSDAQAAEMVRGRLDWKYALSLPLDDIGFDASILTDFRQRLVDQKAQELLLDPILLLCVERGWVQQKGKQRIDSTLVLSCARRLSSLESVGETLRNALNALAEEEPDWLVSIIRADWFDRYVHRFELQRFPKGKEAQKELIQAVGEDSWKLLQAATSSTAPTGVQEMEEVLLLKRVWDQHYEQREGKINWRDGPAVRNTDRVVSPSDEEARESSKRDTTWLGYKVHVIETCNETEKIHLITHVATTASTSQDVEHTEDILEAVSKKGFEPEVSLMDTGYVSGPLLARQREKGREIVGPIPPDTSMQKKTGYDLTAFELDWEKREAICPQGHTSRRWNAKKGNRSEDAFHVFFAPVHCQVCPVKTVCTKSEKGGRTLTLYPQDIYEAMDERRAEQSGEAFQKRYAARSGIEGTLSEGVRAHGMRRSRYQGMEKTHLQMVSIAVAINVVRIHQMLEREKMGLPPRRVRKRSSFARLQDRVAA